MNKAKLYMNVLGSIGAFDEEDEEDDNENSSLEC